MDPCGPDFSDVSFVEGTVDPSFKCRLKERSRMDLKGFDLWGIAAMGNIFSSGGRMSFISSQRTMHSCPATTFFFASVAMCASALGLVVD